MTEITTVNNNTLVEESLSSHIIESQNQELEFNAERNLTEKSEGSRNSTRKRAHNEQSEEKKPQPHKRLKTHSEYDDKNNRHRGK